MLWSTSVAQSVVTFDEGYPTPGDYDMVRAASLLLNREINKVEFWRAIPRELWAETPPSAEFPFLLAQSFEMVGWQNVWFLTTPTDQPDSAAGKLEWVQRFAPRCMRRQIQIGWGKQLCANSETLLIDDSDEVVAAFRERGGIVIQMPRPWNSLFKQSNQTLEHLMAEFEKLKPPKPTALQTKFSNLKLIPSPENSSA